MGDALLAQMPEIALGVVAFGDVEIGEMVVTELDCEFTLLGDAKGVGDGFGDLAEQRGHLLRRPQVERLPDAHAIGVLHGGAGLDAQQHLVGIKVLGSDVVYVVGSDQRDVQIAAHGDQLAVDPAEEIDVVLLHLQVEVLFAENFLEPAGHFPRLGSLLSPDHTWDLGSRTAGEDDEALAVRFQQLAIDARFVVEAFELGLRDQLHQVLVAGLVPGQRREMIRFAVLLMHPLGALTLCHIQLAADDRFDTVLVGCLVELDHAVHRAMVGDGQAVHAHGFGLGHERINLGQTIQQ